MSEHFQKVQLKGIKTIDDIARNIQELVLSGKQIVKVSEIEEETVTVSYTLRTNPYTWKYVIDTMAQNPLVHFYGVAPNAEKDGVVRLTTLVDKSLFDQLVEVDSIEWTNELIEARVSFQRYVSEYLSCVWNKVDSDKDFYDLIRLNALSLAGIGPVIEVLGITRFRYFLWEAGLTLKEYQDIKNNVDLIDLYGKQYLTVRGELKDSE